MRNRGKINWSFARRLNEKIFVDPISRCWVWVGATYSNGYGTMRYNKKQYVAHRLVYMKLVGAIPEGIEVAHTCHNRSCVNPEHLVLATHAQNMAMGVRRPEPRQICKRGHPLAEDNLLIGGDGRRRCRKCRRLRDRLAYRSKNGIPEYSYRV